MADVSLHFTPLTDAPEGIYDAEILPLVLPRSSERFPLCPRVSDRAEFFGRTTSVGRLNSQNYAFSSLPEYTKGFQI
ncbi:hypothetical protein LX82_00359 [Celeribacter halophilus]|uniref:Uncharacterized protein n=1 Tax=Celeribacter halophilus TaxID=576117 RepID=A0A1I3NMB8_9RHOB|nr:hypothetical protein LX82_00359 [Celeribacter halophilus]SFJ10488.1 hypothetical protein SAMN04488138_1028 [Celeribacter halophilus]